MVHLIKVLATKLGNLNSIAGTTIVVGESQLLKVVL